MSQAQSSFYNYVTTGAAVPVVPAAPPPGVVQGEINYTVLLTALGDFGFVTADAVNVFAEDFQAIILEALTAGILATGIVADIESAIQIGTNAPKPAVIAAAAAPADTVTASSLLAQLLQQDAANLTLVKNVFANAQGQGQYANLPAGFEAQFLGGQILFQQDISAFLSSLPTSLSATNDANTTLISELQALLQIEENLSNTLNQIETLQDLEQPIQLTGLNVVVLLDDAAILTEAALVAAAYAYFAYEQYTPNRVTKTTPGAYSVTVPSGAKYVDIVLIGGGGGGGGYNNAGTGSGGNGGATTATPAGGSTLAAAGGTGGANNTVVATAGASPGNETFDGVTYDGGNGGAVGYNSAGANGSAPGAGGGGGGAYGSYGGAGGTAGAWATETLAVTSGMTTITGTVGAGGAGGSTAVSEPGGTGANGEAFFTFYS
jgi:hypothetical protein